MKYEVTKAVFEQPYHILLKSRTWFMDVTVDSAQRPVTITFFQNGTSPFSYHYKRRYWGNMGTISDSMQQRTKTKFMKKLPY